MIAPLKLSIRMRTRWVAAVLLVCIGFFQATVALSACLPTAETLPAGHDMHAGHASHGADADHSVMRISDLLCKTHCDAENVQASFASVMAPVCVGVSTVYLAPVLLRPLALDAGPPWPDIVTLAGPEPVYLLSARLRV